MKIISRNIQSILIGIAMLLVACAVLGQFAKYNWIGDLFSNFVPQYTLLGGALAFFLFLERAKRYALLMFLFTLFNAYQLRSYWKEDGVVSNGRYDAITVLQFNVDRNNNKIDDMVAYLSTKAPTTDIMVLFEITEKWDKALPSLEALYPFHYETEMRGNRNVAIFSKVNVNNIRKEPLKLARFPIIIAELESKQRHLPFILSVIHPPPPADSKRASQRNRVLKSTAKRMSADADKTRILIGDLNTTPWSPHFKQMVQTAHLRDAQEGMGYRGTWPSLLGDKLGIPIDHLLVSQNIKIKKRETGPGLGSDHLPVITTLEINVEKRGVRRK